MSEWRKVVGSVFVAASLLVAGAGPALADHEYGGDDGYCYEDEQCEGYGYGDDGGRGNQDYDQWNNEDRNRNRNRNRGAFSPGPFDRSPLDFRNACISLDCSNRGKDDEHRRDERDDRRGGPMAMTPQSLFPPSPDAVRAFVVNTVKAGINMGRLFADTVITFVQDIFVGIA